MEEIGLIPSDSGIQDGKRTGQKMTHYVIQGGAFNQAADKLISDGFKIDWTSFEAPRNSDKKKNKIKYTCPDCGLNAWAKPEAKIICGECEVALEVETDGVQLM
jgi:ribosomal protein S27AE